MKNRGYHWKIACLSLSLLFSFAIFSPTVNADCMSKCINDCGKPNAKCITPVRGNQIKAKNIRTYCSTQVCKDM